MVALYFPRRRDRVVMTPNASRKTQGFVCGASANNWLSGRHVDEVAVLVTVVVDVARAGGVGAMD